MKYSVLISTYKKDNAKHLNEALNSLYIQTLSPFEVVLVEDGEIPDNNKKVISDFKVLFNDKNINFEIIKLNENSGLGIALKTGLEKCNCEWIGRMDSDDISTNDRFEKMFKQIEKYPGHAVYGSQIAQFSCNSNKIESFRRVYLEHKEISKDLFRRNPMNHVSVILNKKAVLRVGSYDFSPPFEDYQLWAKLINSDFKLKNFDLITVKVRTGADMIGRRHGLIYALEEVKFQLYLYKLFKPSVLVTFIQIFKRGGVRLLPKIVLKKIYQLTRSKL